MRTHDERAARPARRLFLLAALAFLTGPEALVGCATAHTIVPGRWVLNAFGQVFDRSGKALRPSSMKDLPVDIVVDWNVDPASGKDIETVEIHLAHADAQRLKKADPMTGTIKVGHDQKFPGVPSLLVIGKDAKYDIELRGPVVDPDHVVGEFLGVSHGGSLRADGRPGGGAAYGVKGTFKLVRVEEEE